MHHVLPSVSLSYIHRHLSQCQRKRFHTMLRHCQDNYSVPQSSGWSDIKVAAKEVLRSWVVASICSICNSMAHSSHLVLFHFPQVTVLLEKPLVTVPSPDESKHHSAGRYVQSVWNTVQSCAEPRAACADGSIEVLCLLGVHAPFRIGRALVS